MVYSNRHKRLIIIGRHLYAKRSFAHKMQNKSCLWSFNQVFFHTNTARMVTNLILFTFTGKSLRKYPIISWTQHKRNGNWHTGKCIYWKYVVEAALSKLTYYWRLNYHILIISLHTSDFWGRMLASGLNFNTYSFSVTSFFHPCQAKHYNMLHSLQIFSHISCMVLILTI